MNAFTVCTEKWRNEYEALCCYVCMCQSSVMFVAVILTFKIYWMFVQTAQIQKLLHKLYTYINNLILIHLSEDEDEKRKSKYFQLIFDISSSGFNIMKCCCMLLCFVFEGPAVCLKWCVRMFSSYKYMNIQAVANILKYLRSTCAAP